MDEYIPTTRVVRGVYAFPQPEVTDNEQREKIRTERQEFFDRWFAAEQAKARADGLQIAAYLVATDPALADSLTSPYKIAKWLSEKAETWKLQALHPISDEALAELDEL